MEEEILKEFYKLEKYTGNKISNRDEDRDEDSSIYFLTIAVDGNKEENLAVRIHTKYSYIAYLYYDKKKQTDLELYYLPSDESKQLEFAKYVFNFFKYLIKIRKEIDLIPVASPKLVNVDRVYIDSKHRLRLKFSRMNDDRGFIITQCPDSKKFRISTEIWSTLWILDFQHTKTNQEEIEVNSIEEVIEELKLRIKNDSIEINW